MRDATRFMDVGVTKKDDVKSRFDLKRELRDCGGRSWKEKKMYRCVVREMLESIDIEES